MRTWLLIGIVTSGCSGPDSDSVAANAGLSPFDSGDDQVDCAEPVQWFYDADGDGFGDDSLVAEACARPVGHVAVAGDCDDIDPDVHPDAIEMCNERDDNCDGGVDEALTAVFYADVDGDGYGDVEAMVEACEAPSGHVVDATDCDDTSASVYPDATETCNGADDDCDGAVDEDVQLTFYMDEDGDSYGDPERVEQACTAPEGTVTDGTDCRDDDAGINPGAIEVCNEVDDDCDDIVDEDATTTFFRDGDGDGYGDETAPVEACTAPEDHVTDGTDCNDEVPEIHPGAPERCNGTDDDCDGETDEGLETSVYHQDLDGDGFGDLDTELDACIAPDGWVEDSTDCDDTSVHIHPGATEVLDGIDGDCSGLLDDLDAEFADAIIEGDVALKALGYVIDGSEDLDGDEIADFLVGGMGTNAAYVISGGTTGETDVSTSLATLRGTEEDVDAGLAVAALSDFNGDLAADLVVGAPGASDLDGAGRAYVFYGPVGGEVTLDLADLVINGPGSDGSLAINLASAGIHAEGSVSTDILVVAASSSGGSNTVHLFGYTDASEMTIEDELARFYAEEGMGVAFGEDITNVGDVDADGYDDVLIGMYDSFGEAGGAYLFRGPSAGVISSADADVVLVGAETLGWLGFAVAGGGDVDGDGVHDMALGAPGASSGDGWVYVVSGMVGAGSSDVDDVAFAVLTDAEGALGTAVAMDGDVNGDGLSEVLVGAPQVSDESVLSGHTALFLGGMSGFIDGADATFSSATANGQFGYAVSFGSDMWGAGSASLAIGAPGRLVVERESSGVEGIGTIYIFFSEF